MSSRLGAAVRGAAISVLMSLACSPALAGPARHQDNSSADPLAKYIYHLNPPILSPRVEIDVSQAPSVREWAEHAQRLVTQWFPTVCRYLATRRWRPPSTITLLFKPDINNPAYTSGSTITISAKWVTDHPDDFGMVIHELTHVIQHYPGRGDTPGWLVEGIADYIRFYRYEPDVARPRVNPLTATYHDAYRTTAAFLSYVTGKYDRDLVMRLDQALRTGAYTDDLFQQITGKTVQELWTEFAGTLPRPRPSPAAGG